MAITNLRTVVPNTSQIWDTYDVDKSGALDKEETKKFVQDTLGNLGSGDEFSQEAFDEVF